MSILNQPNKIAQAIIANGLVTGNKIQNPDNLLNTTDSTAIFGATSDVILGNFPFSIPSNAVIVGISGIIKARLNNNSVPPGSITPSLVDDSSGSNHYYPVAAITGFSGVLQEYSFGGAFDIWGNVSWTADQINNLKLGLVGNSALEVAWTVLTVYYYIPVISPAPSPFDLPGCPDCDSVIQALPFELAQTWEASGPNRNKLVLKSFNLPTGEPITLDMIGDCGGSINVTIDPDLRKEDGENFIENFNIDADLATISTLENGLIQIDLGDFNQRGLDFITPYGHLDDNISEHSVNAVVIITNNGPFNGKLLKRCHIGNLVSAPIETQDEDKTVVVATEIYNFIGDNVQAEQDPMNPRKANITVITNPQTTTPQEEDSATGTTGSSASATLTIPFTVTAANYLRVWISAQIETITSVLFDGVPLNIITSKQNGGSDLQVLLYDLVNPNVGAHSLVITFNNPIKFSAGVNSYFNVDTGSPIDGISAGAIGTSDDPTDSVTTTLEGSLVQSIVGTTNNPTNFTQFGLWTVNNEVTVADRPGAISTRKALAPGLIANTYTLDVITPWAMIMVGIKGINVPTGGVQSVTDNGNGIVVVDNTDSANPVVKFVLAALITALLASSSFISGLIMVLLGDSTFLNGIALFLSGDSTFINLLTSNTLFQTNVNSFVSGGGNSSLLKSLQYLYIASRDTNAGTSDLPSGYVITNATTNRIYVPILRNGPSNTITNHRLRIFKNDFGSFYEESNFSITTAMLTQPSPSTSGNVQISWFTDNNFIYAIIKYTKTTATTYTAVDVIRFDLDGTYHPGDSKNISLQSGTTSGDTILWSGSSPNFSAIAACASAGSFFTTWKTSGGVNQFREYTISGTTYTLVNTYTYTPAGNRPDNCSSMNRDVATGNFYMYGGDNGGGPSDGWIFKFVLSGSTIIAGSPDSFTYPEFGYECTSDGAQNPGYMIAGVQDFQTTSYVIYLIILITNDKSTSSSGSSTFWQLQGVTFPKQ